MPQEKYKIFDKMIEGVQIIDSQWRYAYVNDTVVSHSKYSREELLGNTMMEKYPGIENTLLFQSLRKCMDDNLPSQMVNEFDFPDGSKGYFELRIQPVPEGVLVMSFDVTKQKQAERILVDHAALLENLVEQRTAELSLKNRELEQFTYIASHDLQEPIRTVLNYIQVFEEDYRDRLDETSRKYLRSMDRAMKRMSLLTKSLLEYSLLGNDRKTAMTDVGKLIGEVLADLGTLIQSTGAVIDAGNMPAIRVYETELRQLFQNLITNAIKFRQKDLIPHIIISSQQVGDATWKFSISDNGIGIEPVYFERIFQIFQRLHISGEYDGCGIGLANCKKIVELHKGKIFVESVPGKGSTFIFTITAF